jgi:hypothetical protein
MVVTRVGFAQVVGNAFAGFGFAPEGPIVYEFPNALFLDGSDLTPINENIDKIVAGLTTWKPKTPAKGTYYAASNIKVQGTTYQQAVDNVNSLYMRNEWVDGLPLIPPNDERVNWILTGTDLPPSTVVGKPVMPRGGVATVHDIAVNLAMAGGRPEYLPVVMAAIEAITDPKYSLAGVNATTRNTWHGFVVNGTIGKQIRINCTYQTMGPNALFPAQGPIGRALRFMLQNFGGAVPGKGTMAIYGAMRYTDTVLAEDEDGLPASWPTHGQDRGFKRGENCVTVTPLEGVVNINNTGLSLTEDALDRVAAAIGTATSIPTGTDPDARSGLILFPRGVAAALYSKGYTKDALRKYMWDNTKLTNNPSQLSIVFAGGTQSGHAYYMKGGNAPAKVTRAITLPKAWNDLLARAEKDLGPAQPQHS